MAALLLLSTAYFTLEQAPVAVGEHQARRTDATPLTNYYPQGLMDNRYTHSKPTTTDILTANPTTQAIGWQLPRLTAALLLVLNHVTSTVCFCFPGLSNETCPLELTFRSASATIL